jgi:glycosyltransferase involved in cell wall biosynthesis
MYLPLISVVMSVKNSGIKAIKTIQSILNQQKIDLEFIIVDDGSSDDTRVKLSEIAATDNRIKLLFRQARGLTLSLIEACEYAKGEFIARQDVCDYSMPERLFCQASSLAAQASASICSSYVRFITEERVTVWIQCSSASDIKQNFTGIIHGSTMFRRNDYIKVGGYRQQFYYAQDVDLWSRLIEIGEHIVIPEILYENCLFPDSISGSRKKEQTKLHKFIVGATKARRAGKEETLWLKRASSFSNKCRLNAMNKLNNGNGAYFIGACLTKNNPLLAKKYLDLAINHNPFDLRARLKVLGLK